MVFEWTATKAMIAGAVSAGAGLLIIIQDAVGAAEYFGALGSWLVGVLLLALGALIAFGIKDFRESQRRLEAKVDKLEDQVFARINEVNTKIEDLKGDLREHIGRTSASREIAEQLAQTVLSAQKKTPLRKAAGETFGSDT